MNLAIAALGMDLTTMSRSPSFPALAATILTVGLEGSGIMNLGLAPTWAANCSALVGIWISEGVKPP